MTSQASHQRRGSTRTFKIALSVFVFLLIAAFAVPVLTGISLVIPTYAIELNENPPPATAGTTVCVLKDLDFENGEWAAYMVTATSDLAGLPEGVSKQSFLITDKKTLKEMQREWCFIESGGDVATVESHIAILQNGKLRWESGIVIESGTEGLQSSQFGWATPKTKNLLLRYAKQFRSSFLPIHIL